MINYPQTMITLSEIFKVVILGAAFGFFYWKFKTSKKGYLIENVAGIKIK